MLIVLLLLLAGCERTQRADDFRDRQQIFREALRLQLFSREVSDALAAASYASELESARAGDQLDADAEQLWLVEEVANRLIAQAGKQYPLAREWSWEVHVPAYDEVNATCRDGGRILVYQGLLESASSADEIALVIGHEMAHALLQHVREEIGRQYLLSSALWLAEKGMKISAPRAALLHRNIDIGVLPAQRRAEREADELGLELMARAGFDPLAGIGFWHTLSARDGANSSTADQRLDALLSDHPLSQERMQHLQVLAARWSRQRTQPVDGEPHA